MFEWYSKYSCSNITEIKNYDEFIQILNNNTNNISLKINNIEKEYTDKIENIKNLYNNKDSINLFKKQNSYRILQKELEIIKILTTYTLSNKSIDYVFIKQTIETLFGLSEILKHRIRQKSITINNDKKSLGVINRCSYKFCNFKENCTYNYNKEINKICYQDHYVHNMVSVDLKNLLDYINSNMDKNSIELKEILKTINTLSYVITHMENELRLKCLYISECDWESCHFTKIKS